MKKRKNIRFESEVGTLAYVAKARAGVEFKPEQVGLVYNESYGGCAAAFVKGFKLKKGDFCVVRVGDLSPMYASIRWVEKLDKFIFKVGFKYED